MKDFQVGLRFWVEIDGIEVAAFTECSGLSVEWEMFEYSEGGNNSYTHRIPTRLKYSNVTLKRGLDLEGDLYDWFKKTIHGVHDKRRNVTIKLYGPHKKKLVRKWDLMEAHPVKWTGPDMKTDAGAVAFETIEFAHKGFVAVEKGKDSTGPAAEASVSIGGLSFSASASTEDGLSLEASGGADPSKGFSADASASAG